ncbi:uncharacterized protein LOC129586106 [Paramacrobiotus metropolitanus]|uniref:uncharacterized protein LOC129586106 n=1 Tax=Paramacrobiotus metropolitanus TaxID=2943436 RepID=UPI00244600A7|nr:uncharacterized protein LOC129586106 [Paramacrobiotus metropolitanus]
MPRKDARGQHNFKADYASQQKPLHPDVQRKLADHIDHIHQWAAMVNRHTVPLLLLLITRIPAMTVTALRNDTYAFPNELEVMRFRKRAMYLLYTVGIPVILYSAGPIAAQYRARRILPMAEKLMRNPRSFIDNATVRQQLTGACAGLLRCRFPIIIVPIVIFVMDYGLCVYLDRDPYAQIMHNPITWWQNSGLLLFWGWWLMLAYRLQTAIELTHTYYEVLTNTTVDPAIRARFQMRIENLARKP